MDINQKYDEMMNYILYPKKLPVSVILEQVSVAEYIMLSALIGYEQQNCGRYITVNELALELEVSIPAVSRMLKNLESRDIIAREQDKNCRRNTFVYITQTGRKLFAANQENVKRIMSKILERFTEQEIDLMLELRHKVTKIIEDEAQQLQNKLKERVG